MSKEYIVKVTETKEYYTVVEAENIEEAKEKAEQEFAQPLASNLVNKKTEIEIKRERVV